MKRIITLLPLLATAMLATAGNITEDEARDIAKKFINANAKVSKAKATNSTLSLGEATTGHYVFNRGDGAGYVIVAADDNAASEVLAYADEGSVDADNIPDNLRWWLDEYDKQVEWLASQGKKSATTKRVARQTVEPMLKSKWSQDSPYNDKCPLYKGQATYSGCVATAIAQIMRYHQWPEKGTGTVSYRWVVNNSLYQVITADLSQSTYQWSDMTDTYWSTSTTQQKEAVAQLMYDVAVASHMVFSPSGSGANSIDAAKALANNFSYDKGLSYIMRDYYTHNEWEDIIYGEIAAARPVYYSGATSRYEGHAFVLDGYDNGYYHVNWGWEGVSDGYFMLSALDPSTQGIGGSTGGYHFYQEAIVGIEKTKGTADIIPIVYSEEFMTSTTTTTRNASVTFGNGFYYEGLESRKLTFGLKVVSSDGAVTYLEGPSNTFEESTGYANYSVRMTNFPTANGTYSVYPAFLDNVTGTWYDTKVAKTTGEPTYLTATVNGNSITFARPSVASPVLQVSNIEASTKAYTATSFKGKASVSATTGDYYGTIHFGFIANGESKVNVYDTTPYLIDMAEGESQQIDFSTTAPTEAGEYTIVMLDGEGNTISDGFPITVREAPTSDLALTFTRGLYMPSTTDVWPDKVEISAFVKCTGGLYSDNLYLYFFKEDDTESGVYYTAPLTIAEGESAVVTFTGAPLEPSSTYLAGVTYVNESGSLQYISSTRYGNSITFTTASSTGIDNAQADAAPHDIWVYTATGTLADKQHASKANLSQLPKGLYIIKTAKGAQRVINR